MFTMVASAVICGCDHEAQANSSPKSHHSQEVASHSHEGGDHQSQGDHHGKGSVAQDCQSTDVQLPAHFDISKPDLKKSLHLDYAITEEIPSWSLTLASIRGIRGPPPWEEPSQTKPSILLTTQRLRI
jgi:hypothetical protein